MRLILDAITVAVVGFTTVVAAWMVVRGLRRTSPRLMLAVVGTTAVAGLLQWVGPPAPADARTEPPGTTAPPFPSASWVAPSPTPAASAEMAPSTTAAPGGPVARNGASAARTSSSAAPVPSALTEPGGVRPRPGVVPGPTSGGNP